MPSARRSRASGPSGPTGASGPGGSSGAGGPTAAAGIRRPAGQAGTARGRRRDRRGRGLRGELVPRGVPLHRTPTDVFDDLVLDAVEELEAHWSAELAGVEFAVEEVPQVEAGAAPEFDPEVIVDRGIPLGRLYREGLGGLTDPVVVIYRRPVEARAIDRDDRADLVFMVVAELVAELLGKDIDEIDPPRD